MIVLEKIESGSLIRLSVISVPMVELLFKDDLESIQFFQKCGFKVIDLTRDSTDEVYRKFHPSFPHGDVPIPEFPEYTAQSVEGIWEGLKMFETTGVDESKFHCTVPNHLARTEAFYGKYLGHRFGVNTILTKDEAFDKIFVPLYRWQVLVKLEKEFRILQNLYPTQPMVWLVDRKEDRYDDYIPVLTELLQTHETHCD